MGTPVILYDPEGKPLLTSPSPWGDVLLSAEPSRIYGWFKSATVTGEAGAHAESIVECGGKCALFVTDILISATKKAGATVTARFYDGTNAVNIAVLDVGDGALVAAIHPKGRTVGWDNAAFQIVTSEANMDATCTVWYVTVHGDFVRSYAKWASERG